MRVHSSASTYSGGSLLYFSAGSIEMDAVERWQDKAIRLLGERGSAHVALNPYRDDWDSSWEQKISDPRFRGQVNWELQGMEEADIILMYFDPTSESPITLLEFGLAARLNPKKLIVICPEGFWRKGNVDVVCERYGVRTAGTVEEALDLIQG